MARAAELAQEVMELSDEEVERQLAHRTGSARS
jgi:hypothetical protein